jgi:hypothetical protein
MTRLEIAARLGISNITHGLRIPQALWISTLILLLPLCTATAQEAITEESTKSAAVKRITSEIIVDGLLQEPIWGTTPKIELTQSDPRPGEMPTERTEVTLLYDADNLYIGARKLMSSQERRGRTQRMRTRTALRFLETI